MRWYGYPTNISQRAPNCYTVHDFSLVLKQKQAKNHPDKPTWTELQNPECLVTLAPHHCPYPSIPLCFTTKSNPHLQVSHALSPPHAQLFDRCKYDCNQTPQSRNSRKRSIASSAASKASSGDETKPRAMAMVHKHSACQPKT